MWSMETLREELWETLSKTCGICSMEGLGEHMWNSIWLLVGIMGRGIAKGGFLLPGNPPLEGRNLFICCMWRGGEINMCATKRIWQGKGN